MNLALVKLTKEPYIYIDKSLPYMKQPTPYSKKEAKTNTPTDCK